MLRRYPRYPSKLEVDYDHNVGWFKATDHRMGYE